MSARTPVSVQPPALGPRFEGADASEVDASSPEQIADEQLRMLLSHTRAATLIATGFAVVMALNAHGSTPRLLVDGWIVAKLAVALLRIAVAQRHARRGQPGGARWRASVHALLAIDGAVWGVAGYWLMAEPVPLASLIAAALACVTCVATFGLQVRQLATAAYVLPILLPTALGLAQRGDEFGLTGGAGLLLLAVLQLLTARGAEQRFAAGVALRLRAESLARQKDAALQLARQQSAVKAQFLANISHELRTPLHGVLGLTRLLHADARDLETRHRLALIESSGTHLLGLINDLLDISRSETGHFSLRSERFDLATQAAFVADVFAIRAAEKGLKFRFVSALDRPCWVVGDAARFRQVLHNLLGNAIKFTPRGQIELRLRRESTDGRLQVEVQDSGLGISEAEQARIFDAFHQVDGGGSGVQAGAGLGLTITREIARAMGGDITLSSRLGAGSTFVFSAPLPAAAEPLPDPTPEPVRPPVGRLLVQRVLVAEDDDVNALILAAYLDQLGLQHERVANGRDAVERALVRSARPELVLMDWRMPVLDGLAATREIRAQEAALGLGRVPVVALTATASADDRRCCLDSGMDDFLAKPFTLDELRRLLAVWGRSAG